MSSNLPTASALAGDPSFMARMAAAYLHGPELFVSPVMLASFHRWLRCEAERLPLVCYVDREVSLTEAITAIRSGHPLPVSTLGTDPVPGLMTAEQNLTFRAVHDLAHAESGADDTFFGELAVTIHHLQSAPAMIAPILCSEVIGQAAVAVSSGSFPSQRLSAACVNLILR